MKKKIKKIKKIVPKKVVKKVKKKGKKTTPIESDFLKIKEARVFAEWLAISPLLKLLTENELKKIGVDDPEEISLLEIKNQAEFAKKFKLSADTLTDWKKKKELWEWVDEFKKEWGKKKTPSVIAGFYRKAVKEGDAARVKLWLQYFEGWNEKHKIEHDVGGNLKNLIMADLKKKNANTRDNSKKAG